uniref:Glutamate--cysteine ligase n=1 Tax=Soboliphyme baturini TaxID=241478 RepID=A0A183J8U4_9BILA
LLPIIEELLADVFSFRDLCRNFEQCVRKHLVADQSDPRCAAGSWLNAVSLRPYLDAARHNGVSILKVNEEILPTSQRNALRFGPRCECSGMSLR